MIRRCLIGLPILVGLIRLRMGGSLFICAILLGGILLRIGLLLQESIHKGILDFLVGANDRFADLPGFQLIIALAFIPPNFL